MWWFHFRAGKTGAGPCLHTRHLPLPDTPTVCTHAHTWASPKATWSACGRAAGLYPGPPGRSSAEASSGEGWRSLCVHTQPLERPLPGGAVESRCHQRVGRLVWPHLSTPEFRELQGCGGHVTGSTAPRAPPLRPTDPPLACRATREASTATPRCPTLPVIGNIFYFCF